MRVIFPQPEHAILFDFIVQSNKMAQIDLIYSDVQQTFERKFMNPAAHGHFAGIQTIMEMVAKPATPVRHEIEFSDVANSHKNLEWLRTIHLRMFKPLAQYGEMIPGINDIPMLPDCGNYRLRNASVGMGRKMPKATSIQSLMHFWHKSLGEFHMKWLPKLGKIGRLTLEDAEALANEAYKKHIQLACIHPWQDGNGRVARLIENMLRLRWGLAWKTRKFSDRMEYVNDIMEYEDGPEWQNILSTHEAK